MSEVSSDDPIRRAFPEIRLVQFDFLRATEMAALNCLAWIGKGDKESADAAACDAIRGMFDAIDIRGEIVIGEGVKDQAPGLFAGERVGRWREGTPRVDIAIDPLDGTTNLSKGLANSISCIAVAVRGDENVPALQFVPAFYMKKLAYPPTVRKAWVEDSSLPLDINAPISEVIALTARLLTKDVRDVVVMVLDRARNESIIEEVRNVGAQLRMLVDGDIAAALGPAIANSGADLYAGIGGAPEGILAAAGLRCMGGGMQAQMWPRDEQELASLAECGWSDRVDKVYRTRDLVHGDDILFIATGISDSPLLRGVQLRGTTAITHSVLMRQHSGSVRFVTTEHDLAKRPLRLRSTKPMRQILANGAATSFDAPDRDINEPHNSASNNLPWQSTKTEIPCLLLFGAPGSGKGTIGKALGVLPGFTHCSSGDIIRAAAHRKTALSGRWQQVSRGALLPDEVLWTLFDEYLEKYADEISAGCSEHLLLIDGIPRSYSQVSELSKRVVVRKVLHLDCGDQNTALRRLTHRFSQLGRPDDANEQVIRARLRLYQEQTLPLLKLYPEEIVNQIDATRRSELVLRDILKLLGKMQERRDELQIEAVN